MKHLAKTITFVFIWASIVVSAQNDSIFTYPEKKTDYSFETGISFTKFGKGSSGFTKYISPMTSYAVNEDLNLTFGASIAQSNFNLERSYSEGKSMDGFDLNSNLLFSNADLRLSPRVSVGGSVFYEYNVLNPLDGNASSSDFDSKGMQLNLNYHINENASFNFSVEVSEGVNYYDPYYSRDNFFHRDFHNSSGFMHRRNIFE